MGPKRNKGAPKDLQRYRMDGQAAISSLEDLQLLRSSVTSETIGYKANEAPQEGLAVIGEFFVCSEMCKKWLQESLESIGWRENPVPDLDPLAKSHSINELLDATILCFQEACALMIAERQ